MTDPRYTYEKVNAIKIILERKDGKIIVQVKIPANTKAWILMPIDDISKVTENGSRVVTGDASS